MKKFAFVIVALSAMTMVSCDKMFKTASNEKGGDSTQVDTIATIDTLCADSVAE